MLILSEGMSLRYYSGLDHGQNIKDKISQQNSVIGGKKYCPKKLYDTLPYPIVLHCAVVPGRTIGYPAQPGLIRPSIRPSVCLSVRLYSGVHEKKDIIQIRIPT